MVFKNGIDGFSKISIFVNYRLITFIWFLNIKVESSTHLTNVHLHQDKNIDIIGTPIEP